MTIRVVEPPYPWLEPRFRAVQPLLSPMHRWSDGYLEAAGGGGTWFRLDQQMAIYTIVGAESRATQNAMIQQRPMTQQGGK
jgi:hypothetical protein